MSDIKQFLLVLQDSMILSLSQDVWAIDEYHTTVYDPEVAYIIDGTVVDSATLHGNNIHLVKFSKPIDEMIENKLVGVAKAEALADAGKFFKGTGDNIVHRILMEFSNKALKGEKLYGQ